MRQPLRILSIAVIAAGILSAQASVAKAKNQAKAPPRHPTQSPASQRPPQTATPQTYPGEQIQAGEVQFSSQCGFCHGRDAAGGETGPDLTRSKLVAEDNRGDKIGPLIRAGRPDQGMPAFRLGDAGSAAIVAYIHDQKTKADALGGGRRSVDVEDLATGNAGLATAISMERRAVRDAIPLSTICVESRPDMRDWLRCDGCYPSGQPAPARPKVTVWLPSGKKMVRPLESEDEFAIVVLDRSGAHQRYEKSSVRFQIENPMPTLFDQLARYTDDDMHNVYAYLLTLK